MHQGWVLKKRRKKMQGMDGFLSFTTHRLTRPKALREDILYYIKMVFFPTPLGLESLLETSCRCHKPLFPPPVDPKTYI
jgi:hypothetical protein